MDRVLRAEREVMDSINESRDEAATIIEGARERARQIIQRADRRISDLHARCADAIEWRVADLRDRASTDMPQPALDADDHAALETAVDRLATRLTTSDEL